MDINYDEIAGDASASAPSDESLKSISKLAERQVEIENDIAKLGAALSTKKKELEKVACFDLPEAMKAAGLAEFTLESGAKISIKENLRAGITADNLAWCFKWLRDNGHGDIIRNEFKVSFGVGEDESSEGLATHLLEAEIDFNQKEYVHSRTLPAFVRTELEDNEHGEAWEKRFGVFRQKVSKVQRPD